MARGSHLWVMRFEKCVALSKTAFPIQSRSHVARSRNPTTEDGDTIRVGLAPQRYDAQKMAKLFANVRRTDDDEAAVSAELSGVASSIAGRCWHRGALSEWVSTDNSDEHDCSTLQEDDVHSVDERECISERATSNFDVHSAISADSTISQSTIRNERDALLQEMQLLMENERHERERIRKVLAKEHKLSIGPPTKPGGDVSTMKLLSIAKEISGRQPAHRKPQLDERRARREHAYFKNLNRRGPALTPPDDSSYYSQKRSSGTQLVRVLDVDKLPLPLLHHMVCYSLVKHMPAETVLQVISRIAMLRDSESHTAYQNFLRDLGRLASPLCRAEVVALLSRGYQSVSVPFMVDYVRRFGTFSRRFMAKLIQRHAQPQALDFLRYRAGQRNTNQILTRPWALFGYVKMLKKSSAKTYMYHNLLVRGYVPSETAFDRFHSFGTLDADMANTILNSERLLNDTLSFADNAPKEDPLRPTMYDRVLEAQLLGLPLEDIQAESPSISDTKEDESAFQPSRMSTQLVKVQSPIPKRPSEPPVAAFRDVDHNLPNDRSNISWSTPWGRRRDLFHFRGKSYGLDEQGGWRVLRTDVRPHYLKNVLMNKRKRDRRSMRRKAAKLARELLAKRTCIVQN
ncbi:uncharacterized protein BcabD6B2_15070 [Babesia caballi]|uniref:RAP domain-containing protein n=1 Tax=Babesia caballi TaxID=5871 RepID=A0AAV4LQK0_BABCB|nr:hypothetical protein, conserved [Babesia caballi]